MTEFLESNLFLGISNLITLIVAGIIGFYAKRFHLKHAQFLQRFDKAKELFSNITAHIINDPGEFKYITEYKITTDTEIMTVCSYLSDRKSKKLLRLYKEYQKQAEDKNFNGEALVKIMCFK